MSRLGLILSMESSRTKEIYIEVEMGTIVSTVIRPALIDNNEFIRVVID